MSRDKIITAAIGGNASKIKTEAAWQYDHGLLLQLTDVADGADLQVHFSNDELPEAICMLPADIAEGVLVQIPDELL